MGSSIEMLCHTKWLAPTPLPSAETTAVDTGSFCQDCRPVRTAGVSTDSRGRFQARTEPSTSEQWTGSESTRLGFFQDIFEQKTAISTMKKRKRLGAGEKMTFENDFCHFLR